MSADSLARWIKEHTEAGLSKDCLVHIEWLKSDIRDSGSLKKFLEDISLRTADAPGRGAEAVSLLTMHAAKGKEFDAVFLPGLEDGLMPYNLFGGRDGAAETDYDEEARLLYVAMTRARSYLFLSCAKKRILFGREYRLPKSRYLERIPSGLISKRKEGPSPKNRDRQLDLF
ncbi:MAG: hypothetical protein E4H36_10525 [Spirochaetales bacterium]|nr:MAG: hypothetical protein E4H36_10525 [Spirochaetales bacterium]